MKLTAKLSGWELVLNAMYFTEGIILSRSPFGEADEVFSIYTRGLGKINARAQGVKKSDAKLKGHLEPLCLSILGLVSARQGVRLVYASLQEFWPQMREDYEGLRAAYHMSMLINAHCLGPEEDIKVWDLLAGSLRCLDANRFDRNGLIHFVRSFEKKLGSALGYGNEEEVWAASAGIAPFGSS